MLCLRLHVRLIGLTWLLTASVPAVAAPPLAAPTYSPTEMAAMRTLLLLPAGTSLPLSLAEPKSGVWKAEFGIIDPQGNYTAPPYTPSMGEDVITFTESGKPGFETFTVLVRILPNPAIPGSSQTPYVIAAPITSVDASGEVQRLGDDSPIVFPKSVPLPPAKFLRTMTVVQPGEKPLPPVQFTQVRPAAVSKDKSTYIVPARNAVNEVTNAVRIRVNAITFVPRQAKEVLEFADNSNTDPDPRTLADANHR